MDKRCILLVLVVALDVGCAGQPEPAATTTPTPPPAPGMAQDAKLAAITRCQAGFEAVQDGIGLAALGQACADMYPRSPCHEAWIDLDSAAKAQAVASACGRAYCPVLPAPLPALCAPGARVPGGDELEPLWVELDVAILAHELGLERDMAVSISLARLMSAMMRPVGVRLPPREPRDGFDAGAPYAVITIEPAASGCEVAVDGENTSRHLSSPATESELAGVVAMVQATGQVQVLIVMPEGMPHGVAMTIHRVLWDAGITRISLATRREEPAGN